MSKKIYLNRLITVYLTVVLILSVFTFENPIMNAADTKTAKIIVKVNGKTVNFPYAPTIISNVIFAPAGVLIKSLGGSYKYNLKTKTITITKSKISVIFKLDSKSVKVNGKTENISAVPRLNKVPFIPVKFIGEKLGYSKYTFDEKTNIVNLKNYNPTPTPVTPINIYIAGDSTAETRSESSYPAMGFGQVLGRSFDKNVIVNNCAISGYSSKSFADLGNLDDILGVIKPGDYLFICFGHNDQKPSLSLHTEPYKSYQTYLLKYINGARRKKAIPVLITSVNRRTFLDNGKLDDSLGDYPDAMIQLGKRLKVPVIDLNGKSKILFEALGPEKTKELFLWLKPGEYPSYPDGIEDNSHFQEKGAIEICKIIAEGIKEVVGPPLSQHILTTN